MRLNLVVFKSSLASAASLEATHGELLAGLKKDFELSLYEPGEEGGKEGFTLAFIASGGSENAFKGYVDRLPRPLLLLSDGLANSLAASLEILAWLAEMGEEAEILHGGIGYLTGRIEASIASQKARAALAGAKIGVIGFPSEWLIASSVDFVAAKKRWGSTFQEIELSVLDDYLGRSDESEATAVAEGFGREASAVIEPDEADLLAAARVYLALKSLAKDYGLSAFTLKCFDILEKYRTTGCLALALLNQEGLVAGCEGDERSVFSMFLARAVTGQVPFMANPSQIDIEANRVVFAHCTIAPCLTRKYKIRSHFESGIGVGIQGLVEEGPVTILKIGGPALDRYFLSSGNLVENLDDPRRCRTQLKIDLEGNASYFLRSPLSNHHVLLLGDQSQRLSAFLDGEGLERVR